MISARHLRAHAKREMMCELPDVGRHKTHKPAFVFCELGGSKITLISRDGHRMAHNWIDALATCIVASSRRFLAFCKNFLARKRVEVLSMKSR